MSPCLSLDSKAEASPGSSMEEGSLWWAVGKWRRQPKRNMIDGVDGVDGTYHTDRYH